MKILLKFHQGWTDIILCLGLIYYYSEISEELVVIMRKDSINLMNFCFKNNKNIKFKYFLHKNNEGEKTTLVSTDSYRLATNTISNLPINDAGIISFRSLNETIKLFEDVEGKIFINSTERELHFYNEKYYTSVRKLEGSYPQYQALFPKENVFSIEVDKKKILESLDRSTVVAEGFIPVTLKVVDENTLNIFSTNKDIGGGVEEIDVKILGLDVGDVSDFKISFNPNYLIQGIEVLDGGKAFLRFSGNDKPAVIQGEEEAYQYLLMPVRTNE